MDTLEFFGGAGGVTKIAIRRKLKAGPVVDLVYGHDLNSLAERRSWITYVMTRKPKVVIMGPPCTHFGSFSNINRRYEGFDTLLARSKKLADCCANIAMIQL